MSKYPVPSILGNLEKIDILRGSFSYRGSLFTFYKYFILKIVISPISKESQKPKISFLL